MPPIREILARDAAVCHALGILYEDDKLSIKEARARLAMGYFSTLYRDRVLDLLGELDDGVVDKEWMAKGRRALDALLKCEIIIYPFLRHPFQYGCRLPYYHEVVHEIMWMERIVYRFEVQRMRTLEQDVRTMFQNYIDYSTVVNPSTTWVAHTSILYQDFYKAWNGSSVPTKPLLFDGLTERFRVRGEAFEPLMQQRDQAKEKSIQAIRQARQRRLFRPAGGFQETWLFDPVKQKASPSPSLATRRPRRSLLLPSTLREHEAVEEEEDDHTAFPGVVSSELEQYDRQTNEELAKRTQSMVLERKRDREIRQRIYQEAKQIYQKRVAEIKQKVTQRATRIWQQEDDDDPYRKRFCSGITIL